VKLFPAPSDQIADAEPDDAGENAGGADEQQKVPEPSREIPGIQLFRKLLPGKWRGSNKSDEEPAVSRKVLDGGAS
jgi:hypothetical protein